MERVRGIEPPLLAWKARALPLSYTRIAFASYPLAWVFARGEHKTRPRALLSSIEVSVETETHYSGDLHRLVGAVRFELTASCCKQARSQAAPRPGTTLFDLSII